MKKRILSLILTLVLLLLCLMACSGADTSSSATNQTEGEFYPDFEMPEETDTLILYNGGWEYTTILTPAVERFKELYPEVHVILNALGSDELETTVRTEIPAGRGPDVLYATEDLLPDIYKTMMTGVFEDLNPYIESDDAFSLDDYIRGIMDSILMDGRRYILPVQHHAYFLTTTDECLADAGLDRESFVSFESFCASCRQYMESHPGNCYLCIDVAAANVQVLLLRELYLYSGIRVFDYESRKVILDREKMKTICDVCKAFQLAKNSSSGEPVSSNYSLRDCIVRREALFHSRSAALLLLFSRMLLRQRHEHPITMAMPNTGGGVTTLLRGFAAIPKGAENKLNAWRFLKVLLSEEIQNNDDTMRAANPVRKSSLRNQMAKWNEEDGYCSEEELAELAEYMTAIDDAQMLPPILWKYLRENMMPYIKGNKDFDECFDKLVNVLELYIDE